MGAVKPYRLHTRVVIDMATMQVLEDEWHLSTVKPALCYGAAAAVAMVVVTAASAIYSADRSRYATNTQQDAMLRQAAYNQKIADYQEGQRQLELQAAYERNSYEMQMAGMQEARAMMMMDLYGVQMEMIEGQQALVMAKQGLLSAQTEIMAQRYALEKEVYDWQLATMDWEADFRMQEAAFIAKQGEFDRSLYGRETAQVLARHRARMAAAGWDIGTGSPLAVLGQMSSDRQYVSDIMKFGSDVNVWQKEYEAKQLLNSKNRIVFGKTGAALDYGSNVLDMQGGQLNLQGSLLDLKGDMASKRAQAFEAGLGAQGAKLQQGLLASGRLRLGEGAAIDLSKYQLGKEYAGDTVQIQSDIYNTAAGAAAVGGYLNVGASIFSGYQSYYTAKNKYGDAMYYGHTPQYT